MAARPDDRRHQWQVALAEGSAPGPPWYSTTQSSANVDLPTGPGGSDSGSSPASRSSPSSEITESLIGGDQVFGRILLWVVGLVISTMITYYCVRGAGAQPRQATKLGAAAGGAIGAVFMVLMGMFGLLDAMFKVQVTPQWTAILVAMNAVGFAFAGAAGGLAIDRHWGGSPRPSVRVARLLLIPADAALGGQEPVRVEPAPRSAASV